MWQAVGPVRVKTIINPVRTVTSASAGSAGQSATLQTGSVPSLTVVCWSQGEVH